MYKGFCQVLEEHPALSLISCQLHVPLVGEHDPNYPSQHLFGQVVTAQKRMYIFVTVQSGPAHPRRSIQPFPLSS